MASLVSSGGGLNRHSITYFRILLQKGLYEEAFVLAVAASRTKEYQHGLSMFEQLLEFLPDELEVRYNYAVMLEKSNRFSEASNQYRLLFESAPAYVNGAIGYARAQAAEQKYCQAVTLLQDTLAYVPENMVLLAAYANALIFAGEPERALIYYRIIFETAPDDRRTTGNFLYTLLMVRDVPARIIAEELERWSTVPVLFRRVVAAGRQLADLGPQQVAGFHRMVGRLLEAGMSYERPGWIRKPTEERRLKIGYLSSDLYSHPMGYLMQGVIPNHDYDRFEIYVFSPFAQRDGLTAELRHYVDHWVVIESGNRDSAAELIRSLQLDLLVELSGHTGDNWLDLCARRLAPLQLTWGGYPSSTGLTFIDYLIADRVSLPDDEVPFYSEKPLRLQRSYACFIPPKEAPLPAPLPAERHQMVTFGCFFTVHKLSISTVELWGGLLRAMPNARLYLKARAFDDEAVRRNCLEKFMKLGVAAERLDLAGGSPRIEMLDDYRHIDIALDPFPYQGGITILEAAWMGVPTLLLRSHRPPFVRHGENYLVQLGLADWIADTPEEYLVKAASWASNLQGLSDLRNRLRLQMAASSICDTAGFTRDLEAAYEQAWYELTEGLNSR